MRNVVAAMVAGWEDVRELSDSGAGADRLRACDVIAALRRADCARFDRLHLHSCLANERKLGARMASAPNFEEPALNMDVRDLPNFHPL